MRILDTALGIAVMVISVKAQAGVYCDSHDPTIYGTPGNDVIIGTMAPDVIVGLQGNDVTLGWKEMTSSVLGPERMSCMAKPVMIGYLALKTMMFCRVDLVMTGSPGMTATTS